MFTLHLSLISNQQFKNELNIKIKINCSKKVGFLTSINELNQTAYIFGLPIHDVISFNSFY